ncbi:hypothetical protein [uncultured Algibacter sp.]|uniref:hypothetical protein n=1 Tax=uncultured Algibacter sp. TaxID=298659 RepID=UPI002617F3A3|nr:hypothetical protein [uncultured Algibacter sp.]
MYNFSIKIDDKEHSLNAENGISMNLIAELLKDLYKAIDLKDGVKCTLSSIRGNCYALDFSSDHKTHLERFKVVHRNIEGASIQDLNFEQRNYAKTLKKVMDGKFYVNAYDENKNKIASINEIKTGKSIKYYYTQKTIYGYLSELGGKTLNSKSKHIIIDGYSYQIKISKDLDLKLKDFYRTQKLAVKIRIKRTFEKGSVLEAEMIDFKKVGKLTLSENLKNEGYIPFEKINNLNSLDGIIEAIYGNN